MRHRLLFVAALLLFFWGCSKEDYQYDDGVSVRFSTDTLLFDTVFSNVGSVTRAIRIYNPSDVNLKIRRIYLGGRYFTGNSDFRLNINGVPSNMQEDVLIPAKDSIYVFVEVTVNPTNMQKPLLVRDSIVVERANGSKQNLQLVAVGRNAYFYNSQVLPPNLVWTSEKPIVIYNSVLVDSLQTLTIQPGTEIYFAKNSSLYVLGTLIVQGSQGNPVRFRGDRIDPYYRDLSGSWGGIHLLKGSVNNRIDWADIRNGSVGIRVDSLPVDGSNTPNLQIRNTRIDNMVYVGILGYTARILGENLLLTNCGRYTLAGDFGGDYRYRHCTVANVNGSFSQTDPALAFANTDYQNQANTLQLQLLNNIVWGSRDEQIGIGKTGRGNVSLDIRNTLMRTQQTELAINQNILNRAPKFIDPTNDNYRIDTLSPAFKAGADLRSQFPTLTNDLDGKARSATPTLGCYERVE